MTNADKYWLGQTLSYRLPVRTENARDKSYGDEVRFHGRIVTRRQTVRNESGGIDISDVYSLSCTENLPYDTMITGNDGGKYTVVEVYRKAGKHSAVTFYNLKRYQS